MEHESDVYTNCILNSLDSHQRVNKRTVGIGNKRMSRDHSNFCIIGIDQNTEKSHGDLKKLAVTETPGENHQLTVKNSRSK